MKLLLLILILTGGLGLFIESFFPGYILALLGSSLLLSAIVLGFVFYGLMGGLTVFGVELVVLLLIFWLWIVIFPKTGLKKKMELLVTNKEEEGNEINWYLGKEGRCESPCKPHGFVRIDSKRVEAVSETGYIEEGVKIKVVGIREGKAIVRAIQTE
ncbi:serine protease [Methylacidiphilum sp. Yel]|uniref:NfeD family protein n=1 Tax=Methylacidiphilum sp. Yel TaxID=1847730 RepID=UPI00106B736D|nr:NfeD family protein [Methylacidiphilum sp. Yel]TFE68577.1 serine protease [Methylacidiphilum sp. Yel]